MRPNLLKTRFRVLGESHFGVLRETQLQNNLYQVKSTVIWLDSGGFMWFQVVSGWLQLVSAGFRLFLVFVSTKLHKVVLELLWWIWTSKCHTYSNAWVNQFEIKPTCIEFVIFDNVKIKMNLKIQKIFRDCSPNFLWNKWQHNEFLFSFIRGTFITLWNT